MTPPQAQISFILLQSNGIINIDYQNDAPHSNAIKAQSGCTVWYSRDLAIYHALAKHSVSRILKQNDPPRQLSAISKRSDYSSAKYLMVRTI